ncbi:hypothetical protein SESBI_20324 [Sesbania bispinosa]|nr:hypothetical protein SESBI_20324 [Sesbania bispinosa]
MGDERATITNKHGKKKIHPFSTTLSIGGEGGITGLLVFGGALAIAGFMAVASFARNKNKAKGAHHHQPKPQQLLLNDDGCKSEDNHETTQTLTSLLQHSTPQLGDVTCCWASNMSIDQVNSSELLSSQPLILEEKIEFEPDSVEESPDCFHHQEIAFSDHSHPESAASSNENGVAEECLESSFNNHSGHGQAQQDEPQEDLTSTETETEEGEEDNDEDDVTEIGEEDSSKATGTTSLDYNEEPVWPAERIQEEPGQEFKRDYCESHVCSDSDADDEAMTRAKEANLNEKANISMVPNDQPSVLTNWVIPMLLLALLLLLVLLNRRPQESFLVLDDGNSVIVP